MQYRRLGRAGLQVSELSFGSWVTYANQVDVNAAVEMMAAAYDAGVNFFDNAEAYAGGKSEEVMGAALKKLGWARLNYTVSTKFFWGLPDAVTVNRKNTLNRKYLMQAIDGSLQRFGLDYLDLVYCHRSDPNTPIEETVHAMSDMITQGKALYWGTSEWSAADIRAAWDIADRHHLHKPVVEQPQYHLFHREKVETGVRAPVRRHRPGPDHLEPAGLGPAHRQVQGGHPGRQPRRDAGHGASCRTASPTRRRTRPSPSSSRSRATWARPPRSWPSPGWRRTRT